MKDQKLKDNARTEFSTNFSKPYRSMNVRDSEDFISTSQQLLAGNAPELELGMVALRSPWRVPGIHLWLIVDLRRLLS